MVANATTPVARLSSARRPCGRETAITRLRSHSAATVERLEHADTCSGSIPFIGSRRPWMVRTSRAARRRASRRWLRARCPCSDACGRDVDPVRAEQRCDSEPDDLNRHCARASSTTVTSMPSCRSSSARRTIVEQDHEQVDASGTMARYGASVGELHFGAGPQVGGHDVADAEASRRRRRGRRGASGSRRSAGEPARVRRGAGCGDGGTRRQWPLAPGSRASCQACTDAGSAARG